MKHNIKIILMLIVVIAVIQIPVEVISNHVKWVDEFKFSFGYFTGALCSFISAIMSINEKSKHKAGSKE